MLLADKSLIMNVYKVYILPILQPALQKTFNYLVECECLALSPDDDYAIMPLEHDMLTCVFKRGYMC